MKKQVLRLFFNFFPFTLIVDGVLAILLGVEQRVHNCPMIVALLSYSLVQCYRVSIKGLWMAYATVMKGKLSDSLSAHPEILSVTKKKKKIVTVLLVPAFVPVFIISFWPLNLICWEECDIPVIKELKYQCLRPHVYGRITDIAYIWFFSSMRYSTIVL